MMQLLSRYGDSVKEWGMWIMVIAFVVLKRGISLILIVFLDGETENILFDIILN